MSPERTQTVIGYAWLVYHEDPCRPDRPQHPFRTQDGGETPGDVVFCRPVEATDPGIRTARPGGIFLVLSAGTVPPEVPEGWNLVPAELDDDFQSEEGRVRLKRIVGGVRSAAPGRSVDGARVLNCEFDIEVED